MNMNNNLIPCSEDEFLKLLSYNTTKANQFEHSWPELDSSLKEKAKHIQFESGIITVKRLHIQLSEKKEVIISKNTIFNIKKVVFKNVMINGKLQFEKIRSTYADFHLKFEDCAIENIHLASPFPYEKVEDLGDKEKKVNITFSYYKSQKSLIFDESVKENIKIEDNEFSMIKSIEIHGGQASKKENVMHINCISLENINDCKVKVRNLDINKLELINSNKAEGKKFLFDKISASRLSFNTSNLTGSEFFYCNFKPLKQLIINNTQLSKIEFHGCYGQKKILI